MRRLGIALLTFVLAAVLPAAPASAATRLSGTLPDGATWIADVPDGWNGTLVLFSHGFRPGPDNPAANAPDPATAQALLDRGYALAGSSYAHAGWALDTAVADQLGTLAAVEDRIGPAREVVALGQSMGGLVSALLAERAAGRVDGVLTTCGLVGGGINLNNYQLDGEHALAELLLPGQDVQLTGFTTPAQAAATVAALTTAVRRAQETPAGLSPIALAASLMNTPIWAAGPQPPTDHAARQQAQYTWLLQTLPFVIPSRVSIVSVAGGDSGWNTGVDYARLMHRSARLPQVAALYREAGLDLHADLGTLTRAADIAPDSAAVAWMRRTSTPTGRLRVPELTLHTIADQLAPVEYQRDYALRVAGAGESALLRQAYVQRVGHCAFTPAEYLAGVFAVQHRIRTGAWSDAARPERLQDVASAIGDAAFVRYSPPPFVNAR
ncbi:alpha/beta hydrolase [Amycolatopsis ruanii]|uniref:alpha/beta hydrolase n=1 Tax=Amycolatopsis ruanii TaxID=944491 RepID=UPI001F0801A6|nr:alpha/beta hydrolase [Amycolatopsis ruanii]